MHAEKTVGSKRRARGPSGRGGRRPHPSAPVAPTPFLAPRHTEDQDLPGGSCRALSHPGDQAQSPGSPCFGALVRPGAWPGPWRRLVGEPSGQDPTATCKSESMTAGGGGRLGGSGFVVPGPRGDRLRPVIFRTLAFSSHRTWQTVSCVSVKPGMWPHAAWDRPVLRTRPGPAVSSARDCASEVGSDSAGHRSSVSATPRSESTGTRDPAPPDHRLRQLRLPPYQEAASECGRTRLCPRPPPRFHSRILSSRKHKTKPNSTTEAVIPLEEMRPARTFSTPTAQTQKTARSRSRRRGRHGRSRLNPVSQRLPALRGPGPALELTAHASPWQEAVVCTNLSQMKEGNSLPEHTRGRAPTLGGGEERWHPVSLLGTGPEAVSLGSCAQAPTLKNTVTPDKLGDMSQGQAYFTEFGVHRDCTACLGLRTRSGHCILRLSAWSTSPTPDTPGEDGRHSSV